ncbi:MAG TPA: 30S ribosomal protein S6 [Herpetosiphonaceae bacterium]
MRLYELMTVLRPDLGGEDDINAQIETLQGYITNQGGSITSIDHSAPWGRRKLAYPIKDYVEGYYVLTHFELDPKSLPEVERSLKLATPVLRYLLTQPRKR